MKLSSLWTLMRVIIIIIIIIGGVIVIIVIRNPIPPIPDPPCLACGIKGVKWLGIAEILLGAVSYALLNRIRNTPTQR